MTAWKNSRPWCQKEGRCAVLCTTPMRLSVVVTALPFLCLPNSCSMGLPPLHLPELLGLIYPLRLL